MGEDHPTLPGEDDETLASQDARALVGEAHLEKLYFTQSGLNYKIIVRSIQFLYFFKHQQMQIYNTLQMKK